MKSINNISNFTVIGSGTLGARIGLQAVLSGFYVTLYDTDEASFVRAKKDFQRIKNLLVKRNKISAELFDDATSYIKYSTDLESACKSADFISESIVEDVTIKKQVWGDISGFVSDSCILTTNTSYLLLSYFAEESGAPERFCAFHFHDVFTARVVDIMPHPGTDLVYIPILKDMGRKLNQIPVYIQKETPGYIFNKLFSTILITAGKMYADGIASVEDIDRSWMGNYGMRIGPMGMMDEVGLDTIYHVSKGNEALNNENFIDMIKSNIAEGKLGIKSGEGFYTYPNPSFKDKDFLFK